MDPLENELVFTGLTTLRGAPLAASVALSKKTAGERDSEWMVMLKTRCLRLAVREEGARDSWEMMFRVVLLHFSYMRFAWLQVGMRGTNLLGGVAPNPGRAPRPQSPHPEVCRHHVIRFQNANSGPVLLSSEKDLRTHAHGQPPDQC